MMQKVAALLMSVVLLIGLAGGCLASPSPFTYHELIWSDEFSDTLDETKWRAMIGTGPSEGYPGYWGNNEAQYYRAENGFVRDGRLVIRVLREDFEGMAYTSARLTTCDLFAFTYGRVEARMKLPADMDGLWPAFWLLPDGSPDEWVNGIWAASGEIDVMESRSRLPGEISGAAHFGGSWPANACAFQKYTFPEGQSVADWHVYSLEWFPDKLIWYVDGQEYFRLEDWYTVVNGQMYGPPKPFDEAFCILLNVAVGGHFDQGRLLDEAFAEAEILVDWVRVYQ